MRRIACFLSVVAIAQLSLAQAPKQIKIDFPGEGSRQVWIGDVNHPGDLKSPDSVGGVSVTLDAPASGEGLIVFVHDKKTGNVAERPLPEILKTGEWKVDPKDEKRVYSMDFSVESGGKPVASAVIKAKAGKETREVLLAPSDKGKASIFNLPAGPVEVTLQYKSEAGTKTSPVQTFEAKLGAGPVPPRVLSISDKVETITEAPPQAKTGVDSKSATAPTKEAEKKPEPAPNPALSLINLCIGIPVIGAIAYGLWVFYKKNPQKVEDALKKVGLGDQPQQDNAPPPTTPVQPQPIKPIVLGDSAPTTSTAPISSPSIAHVANPRLVRPDGSVALLLEGSHMVGREPGLTVSLEGESSVSRNHARLDRSGDEVRLTDLGSTNGTFVNGVKISADTVLRIGDNIQFGAITFRYEA